MRPRQGLEGLFSTPYSHGFRRNSGRPNLCGAGETAHSCQGLINIGDDVVDMLNAD